MTRLYIAGPMTGLPENNYPAFQTAAAQLRAHGHTVENPADNVNYGEDSWLNWMRLSLMQLARVDGVALLAGAQNSRGARLERVIADGLGYPVRSVAEWLAVSA